MHSPRFSIIVPAYNAERYLRECLDSLACQSFEDFEVIIVNDGSKDRTESICREYVEKDNRFRLINKENGGVSTARNTGLENATGEWILFMDADDTLFEMALKDISKSIECYSGSVMHIWGWEDVLNNKKIERLFSNIDSEIGVIDLCMMLFRGIPYMGYVWNKAFRKDLIANLRFAEDIKYNEDRLFIFEYLTNRYRTDRCSYINKPLYRYRIHDNSAMSLFDKGLNEELLTDLMAFHRMALIAKNNQDRKILNHICKCAWVNSKAFEKNCHAANKEIVSKLGVISQDILCMVPMYKIFIWNVRRIIGGIIRKSGIRR